MKRLLPDIYWGPSGRRGIIDTGKTVEFWIRKYEYSIESQLMGADVFAYIMRQQAKHTKKPINFKGYKHYITLEPAADSNTALVYLYLDNIVYGAMFHSFHGLPTEDRIKVKDGTTYVKHCLGQVPNNSRIDKTFVRNLKRIKEGRVFKIQFIPEFNFKVVFPYGLYKFDNNDKIVIDYQLQEDNRFNHLVIEE